MASLANTLRDNKQMVRGPGGQLTEETPESIQTLSGQAGLQAPPITPLGGAMIGANPDQQKMMGTPQQKTAALSLASQPNTSLQDTLRRNQVRTQATGQEQQQQQKSQDMQNLGSLGDRVTDFINVQRKKLEQQAGQGVDVQSSTEFQGKDVTSLKDMLSQYRQNPNDQQLLLHLNQSLGYDLNRQLSPTEVDQLYESAVQSIARGGAGTVDDKLNVDDLTAMSDFGYDKATLSSLLGVPQDQIGKMSVGDLRNKVNEVAANEFSKTQQLDQQAQSGELGQAERGMARQAGQESSRVGTRSTEADINSLEHQISNADQVTFAGQTMKVDDLLKDDTISGIISQYMNAGPDSDIRKTIDAQEPGLRDFIQKNQAVLADASQKMQAGAQTFQETQNFNKRLQSEPFGGIKLDDNLAKAFIPGFGTLQANRVDVNSVPLLKVAADMGPQYGQTMANNLNQEYTNDKSTADDLQGLDYNSLRAWDIGGGKDSAWNTKYIAPKRFWEQVSAMPSGNINGLIQQAASDVTTKDDAQQRLSANRASNVLGFGSSLSAGVVDANGDGIVDSGEQIKAALLKANPRPSLKQGPGSVQAYTKTSIGTPNIPNDPLDLSIYNKLQGAAAKGQVTADDVNKANLSLDEAIKLKGSKGNVDQNAVNQVWSKKRDENTNSRIDAITQNGGSADEQIQRLNAEMSSDDAHVNKDLVRSRIQALQENSASIAGEGGSIKNEIMKSVGLGCFIAGTKFVLADGSLKEVEKLSPHDTLLMGGRTIATAQFVSNEMYFYRGVFVAGSHAVREDGTWTRVRDSQAAERAEELDGSIVYVVWNTGHRMISEHGIEFSDYSETDSTVAEIEQQRNIDDLNRATPS